MPNAQPALVKLRLRAVLIADFRKSPETLYAEFAKRHPELPVGPSDCVAFISCTGSLVQFVRRPFALANEDERGRDEYQVQASTRLRIDGTWSPLKLQNYAERAGIDVQLRRFESYLKSAVRE